MADDNLEGWGASDNPEDSTADGGLNIPHLIAAQNRKKQKSGGFQSMGLSQPVLNGVLRKGYKIPTPIQRRVMPLILEGKDIVAMARTGSGKTAAFLIPLFEKLKVHSAKVGARALILSPTRELAMQTLNFAKALGKYTGLRAAVILGGESMEAQFAAMHENPDIIIATPKRFKHVCIEMNLRLDSVNYVVFDEVDRLFEMQFTDQIKYILSLLSPDRQTLLFSATLPKAILEFAQVGLSDPVLIRLDVDTKVSENLKMAFFKVNNEDKLPLLLYVLRNVISSTDKTVIFAPTRHHVDYLHQVLELIGISNTYIFSSLDPAARKIHMAKFRAGKVNLLIVTDVAARGLDIPLLDNVINFNFPAKAKLFVHRVGRVARANRPGASYSFIAPDESVFLLELHMFLNRSIRLTPFPQLSDPNSDYDRMYGRVPQDVLDNDSDYVKKLHETSYDLQTLRDSANNSLKKYVKSRPQAAPESSRRLKEELWDRDLGYHPLLIDDNVQDIQLERLNLLNKLKNLRPKTTIFEIRKDGKKGEKIAKTSFMEEKRKVDEHKIETFYQKMHRRVIEKEQKNEQDKLAEEQRKNMVKSSEIDIMQTFNKIIGKGRPNFYGDEHDVRETGDHFIPYFAEDRHTEQGYSLMTNFQQETSRAAFDLLGDEDKNLGSRQLSQWDRKKKKYVNVELPKKVLTESGVWVEASYKKDLYEKWKQKMLIEQNNPVREEDSDEDQNEPKIKKNYKNEDNNEVPKKNKKFKNSDNEAPKNKKKFKNDDMEATSFVNLTERTKMRQSHPLLKKSKNMEQENVKGNPKQLKSFDQRMKFLRDKRKKRTQIKERSMRKKKGKGGRKVRRY